MQDQKLKASRQRLAYLQIRIPELAEERKRLVEERKSLLAAMKKEQKSK